MKFSRYYFNYEDAAGLVESVKSPQCTILYDDFLNCIIRKTGVDESVKCLYTLLDATISQNFSKKYMKSNGNKFPRNQWFDSECKTLKHAVNSFSKNNDLNCTASQQH